MRPPSPRLPVSLLAIGVLAGLAGPAAALHPDARVADATARAGLSISVDLLRFGQERPGPVLAQIGARARATTADLRRIEGAQAPGRRARVCALAHLGTIARAAADGRRALARAPARVARRAVARERREVGRALVALRRCAVRSPAAPLPPGLLAVTASRRTPSGLPGFLLSRQALVVTAQDGTGLRRLTSWTADEISAPSWSPDGRRLAVARAEASGRVSAIVVALDGTPPIVVSDDVARETPLAPPTWSADGTELALARRSGGRIAVVAVRVDGPGERVLVADGGPSPMWSPDGTRVAFGRAPAGDRLVVLTLATGERRVLDSRGVILPLGAAWSPDGREILTSLADVVSIDASGGRPRLVSGSGSFGAWIPDGRVILRDPFSRRLVVSETDGSGLRPVLRAFERRLRGARLSSNVPPAFQPVAPAAP